MRFVSTVDYPLCFKMDGVEFKVEPKGECEIPDAKAFAIAGMGIPMVEAPPPAPPPAPAPPPPPQKPKSK